MCGIFGFMLEKPVGMAVVFKVLEKLKVHRYPNELRPVWEYGAGVAVLQGNGKIISQKIEKLMVLPRDSCLRLLMLMKHPS